MEGHGRMMIKGNEASKECFLRRRAFIKKGNSGKRDVKKKGYHTMYR